MQYELDVPLVDLIPQIGLADAQLVYRAARGALDELRDLVSGNAIDCDFARRPSLYLARDESDALHLRHEALAREVIGLEASYLTADALRNRYGIERAGAIRSTVRINSIRVRWRCSCSRSHNRKARASTIARAWRIVSQKPRRPNRRRWTAESIRANHVVYATGYEVPDWLPQLRSACTLMSTYSLVTKPLTADRLWADQALLWEMGSPYFYARTTADGRVIAGGEDDYELDPATRQAQLPAKVRRLLTKLKTLTGIDDVDVETSWAATFAHTADGLP